MNSRRLFFLAILVIFSAVNTSFGFQGGTPHPPILVSPVNGSTVTSFDVLFCATAGGSVVPDQAHFEFYRGPVPDFQSDWVGANAQGQYCATVHFVSNGCYTVATRGRNGAGEGGHNEYGICVQANSSPTATFVPAPVQPISVADQGPDVTASFIPSSSTTVGQMVTISVTVHSGNPGATRVTTPCGDNDQRENTTPSFDAQWNTSGCGSGGQTVRICARAVTDPNWIRPTCRDFTYSLSGAPSANGPSASLTLDKSSVIQGECANLSWHTQNATSVEVNVSGEIYEQLSNTLQVCPDTSTEYSLRASNGVGPDATRSIRLQVGTNEPAPETSGSGDGTSIVVGQTYVAGMTFSDARRSDVPGGFDLIKVAYAAGYSEVNNDNAHWNGWIMSGNGHSTHRLTMDDFQWICRQVYGSRYNATLVGDGQYDVRCEQIQSIPDNGGGSNQDCGSLPSRLSPGDTAVVSDYDPYDLYAFNTQSRNSGTLFTVPIRVAVSIISGPVCADGVIWVEIGYQGRGGWSQETSRNGNYNLIPNGMPLPGGGEQDPILVPPAPNPGTSCISRLSQPLVIGGIARVTPGLPNRIRAGAGTSFDIVGTIPAGGQFEVIGGPDCGSGYVWWIARYNGIEGWTPEANLDGTEWVELVSSPPPDREPDDPPEIDWGDFSWDQTWYIECPLSGNVITVVRSNDELARCIHEDLPGNPSLETAFLFVVSAIECGVTNPDDIVEFALAYRATLNPATAFSVIDPQSAAECLYDFAETLGLVE